MTKLFGLLTFPYPAYGRTRAFPTIVESRFGYRVKLITPDAPVTALPVALFATTNTVELGITATLAKVKLNADVDSPVIDIFCVFVAIRPCAAAVV